MAASWPSASLACFSHPLPSCTAAATASTKFATFLPAAAAPAVSHLAASSLYLVGANILYLARRATLRRTTKRQIFTVRTTREAGVSLRLFLVMILAWQAFVLLFPVVEPAARLAGRTSLFFSYPNARGVGFILEPLAVQDLTMSARAREQIRLDWHEFRVNVGGLGRHGYRHPPAVRRNWPHVDIPRRGMRHWPWRRKREARPGR